MMNKSVRTGLVLIALLQFIPTILLPPQTLLSMPVWIWITVLVIFGLLGFNLLRLRAWSRTASIFIQGFNIIVRLLVMVGHAVQGGEAGNPVDIALLASFVLSMILSTVILYYVDRPDVQIVMQ